MKKLLKKIVTHKVFILVCLIYGFFAGLVGAGISFGWFKVIVILIAGGLGVLWAVADFNNWFDGEK